jgi:hypothetical protein
MKGNINPLKEKTCPNCFHPLKASFKYCPNCGQKTDLNRLDIKDFFHEFLANFYAYDSRIKQTVTSLFAKPGEAAKNFIQGKRHQYANPFRFYLSISLIYFIFSGIVHKVTTLDKPNPLKEVEILQVEKVNDSVAKDVNKPEKKFLIDTSNNKLVKFSDFYNKYPDLSTSDVLDSLGYSKSKWNFYLYKKVCDAENILNANKSAKRQFQEFIEAKLPFILFISLPLLTFVFSLVYVRTKINYAEHLVLVFNLMTFIFLLLLINKVFLLCFSFNVNELISIGFPFYFYKALRNFYNEKRWRTLVKFVILIFLLSIAASLTALFTFLLVFLIY